MINTVADLFLIEHHVTKGTIYQSNQRGGEADGEQRERRLFLMLMN